MSSETNTEYQSPAEAAEARIEQQRKHVHKYLSIGVVIGAAFSAIHLAINASIALIFFVGLSFVALVSVPALAHSNQSKGLPILFGAWMGHIISFGLGAVYYVFVEARLLEIFLSGVLN